MKLNGNFAGQIKAIMTYKIRVILDAEDNVIRDIAIRKTDTLEDLHNAVTNAFGFDGSEMASFYLADEDWIQGEEFPLFDMSDQPGEVIQMREISIADVLSSVGNKMIYVYDFFSMWTFFVELMEDDSDEILDDFPKIIFALGHLPHNAPEKNFEADPNSDFDMDMDDEELDEDFDFEGFSYDD